MTDFLFDGSLRNPIRYHHHHPSLMMTSVVGGGKAQGGKTRHLAEEDRVSGSMAIPGNTWQHLPGPHRTTYNTIL